MHQFLEGICVGTETKKMSLSEHKRMSKKKLITLATETERCKLETKNIVEKEREKDLVTKQRKTSYENLQKMKLKRCSEIFYNIKVLFSVSIVCKICDKN